MNTNKAVHNQDHLKQEENHHHSNPSNKEMIKTSTFNIPHNHRHHLNHHSYDMIQSAPPLLPQHATTASGMLPSLSHHYDTSSVPSNNHGNYSPPPPLHHQQYYNQESMIHKREQYGNNHQRYHPYQRRSPVSPPTTSHAFNSSSHHRPQQQHVMGGSAAELHNCSIDSATNSSGTNSAIMMNHHQYQQHQPHVNNYRSSPTKKSPISSEHNDMSLINQQTDVNMQNGISTLVSNNRKKIPNRSSYETHVFMNAPAASTTTSNPVQPPQKRKNVISKQEMIRVLHLPQTQASSILGCSLSTLKRRFYELKEELEMEKWPQFYHEIRHLPIFSKVYPMSFYFMLNHEGCDDVHKPLTKQHLQKNNEMYEQYFQENTNHFFNYCKSLR